MPQPEPRTSAPPPDAFATSSPRFRRVILALAAALAIVGTLAVAFAPWLLVEHPLLLAAMAPDAADLILVSGSVAFLPLLAVALPMRVIGVLTSYAMGGIYGRQALMRVRGGRAARLLAWVARVLDRVGPPLLVVLPAYAVALLAGAARLQPRRAVPAIALGQLIAVTASYYLGAWIGPWTDRLIAFLSEHLLISTAACAAGVVLWNLWRKRRSSS